MNPSTPSTITDWQSRLAQMLPLFGHRNWIVVADSAYPAQSNPGIETIATASSQSELLRHVVAAIQACKHIRAHIYLDHELDFVAESDAPGIAAYRQQLADHLHGSSAKRLAHEEIIEKLDRAAKMFRILVLKSEMTIPYTSVFFELDCAYWDAEAEQRLRDAIGSAAT